MTKLHAVCWNMVSVCLLCGCRSSQEIDIDTASHLTAPFSSSFARMRPSSSRSMISRTGTPSRNENVCGSSW